MTKTKSWKPYNEQLALLKERGLQVLDDERALNYIERIGYYRLSGYWYPLRAIDVDASMMEKYPTRSDLFVEGSRFEDVVKLYIFDKKLRLLALDALERIEMAVRVDVAHTLGRRHPLAHLRSEHLDQWFARSRGDHASPHSAWVTNYEKLAMRSKNEPFVKHHAKSYEGQMPIWVAVEIFDFGTLSKLFAGMKGRDKISISKKYGETNGVVFQSWLRSLTYIRNVAAHHSRLWNINVVETAKESEICGLHGRLDSRRPFFYFYLMALLLNTICPNSSWGSRFRTLLLEEFPRLPDGTGSLYDMGAIQKWDEWDVWGKK